MIITCLLLCIIYSTVLVEGRGEEVGGQRSEGAMAPLGFEKKKTLLLFAISMTNKFLYIGPF